MTQNLCVKKSVGLTDQDWCLSKKGFTKQEIAQLRLLKIGDTKGFETRIQSLKHFRITWKYSSKALK